MMVNEKHRYYVIFTETLKQWDVKEAIRCTLPEEKGTVFYPCAELWMGSLGRTVIQPLFPGYVFIRSGRTREEVHTYIREQRKQVLAFMKELGISERRMEGEENAVNDDISDLNDRETELLDFMFGFQYKECEDKIPETGVLAMSYGYRREGGGYVVMEGPLQGYEDRIVDVNPKDRRAYLNLKVRGRPARAGLTLRGKKYWFPHDKGVMDVLNDGTEINCHDIAEAMMRQKN